MLRPKAVSESTMALTASTPSSISDGMGMPATLTTCAPVTARAGMEAQILYAQQGEALLVNALPIGLGLT